MNQHVVLMNDARRRRETKISQRTKRRAQLKVAIGLGASLFICLAISLVVVTHQPPVPPVPTAASTVR